MPDNDADLLRLIALDAEDLAIVSAHLQDAVLKVKDITWLSGEGHFVLALNRFVWETAEPGLFRRNEYQRRRTGLHFARVKSVQSAGIDRGAPETVLELLAIRFIPGESPSGEVLIDFAGGASLRLAVEVIEVEMTDLGPAWSTPHAPRHIVT
jgi:Protein of unknown function (DUF2948)